MANLLGPSEEILLSIIETEKLPSSYGGEQAENKNIKRIVKNISYHVKKFASALKQKNLTSADAFFTKKMILNDLMVLAAVLTKKLKSDVIDAAVQKAGETAAPRLGATAGSIVSASFGTAAGAVLTGLFAIGGAYLSIKQMIDDNEQKHKVAALLDSIFGGKRLSKFNKRQRLKMFKKEHRWMRTNKVVAKRVLFENNKKNYQKVTEKQTMSNQKILEEYILQNTPQQSRDVSIIEIIADEVNQALNNHPEIQLAGQVLNEDELKELFSPLAKQIVTNVYGQMEENIKNLVEAEIDDALLAKVVSKLEGNEDDEELTPEEMMSIKNSLPSDVLSVDPQKIQNIAEQEE